MTARRAARVFLVLAVLAHVIVRLALWADDRFFASEDDAYRLYTAYLGAHDPARWVGKFWLPGQRLLLAPLIALGMAPVWAGLTLSTAGLLTLVFSLALLARRLCSEQNGRSLAAGDIAAGLVLVSPMALTLSHSALVELPGLGCVALAASALLVRFQGGTRRVLISGALILALATWFRYEAWLLTLPYAVTAAVAHYGRTGDRRAAVIDGCVASLCGIGPLVWMLAQWETYGSPLAFIDETSAIAEALGAGVSRGDIVRSRLVALALWAPVVAGAGLFVVFRAPSRGAVLFAAWLGLGVIAQVVSGGEHPVFPARLAFTLEVALVPLAASGIAGLLERYRAPGAVLLGVALSAILLAPLRPSVLDDPDSVRFGHELRRGEHDAALGKGALLVERPERRPPFGWAAVATLWNEWPRTVFATALGDTWELVEPTAPRTERAKLPARALPGFLEARDVQAAWLVTPAAARMMRQVWPNARVESHGKGFFLVRTDE